MRGLTLKALTIILSLMISQLVWAAESERYQCSGSSSLGAYPYSGSFGIDVVTPNGVANFQNGQTLKYYHLENRHSRRRLGGEWRPKSKASDPTFFTASRSDAYKNVFSIELRSDRQHLVLGWDMVEYGYNYVATCTRASR